MRKVSLLLVLILSVLLAGCSSDAKNTEAKESTAIHMEDSPEAVKDLTMWIISTSECNTLNPFHSQLLSDAMVSYNLYDTLVGIGSSGEMIPLVAESWEVSEDGLAWTFHLREDCYWVDAKKEKHGTVTSTDFATGLEWCLNFYKNDANGVQMITDYIQGAAEYYEYTVNLPEAEADALKLDVFYEMVGVETPDEHTLTYHLLAPCSYFPSIVTSTAYYPAPSKLIEEIGVDQFLINPVYLAWYNGPYLLTEYIPENEKIYDANPYWYGNEEHTRFASVTVKCLEESSMAFQLYKNGEVDEVKLGQSKVTKILSDPEDPYYDLLQLSPKSALAYMMNFNYARKDESGTYDENWNKAAANEAFRKSIYYGLDITPYLKLNNAVNPYSCSNETITSPNLAKFSDGRDYTEAVLEKAGITGEEGSSIRRLDKEKAEQYKQQAMEELKAQGVTFPVKMVYYVQSSNPDGGKILRDAVKESLGEDYVVLELKTYMNSYLGEVISAGTASIIDAGWQADYGDPSSVLGQYQYGNENAIYAQLAMNINDYHPETGTEEAPSYLKETLSLFEEYTALYEKAAAITDDQDSRYEAFAEAEAYALSHVLCGFPFVQNTSVVLSNIDQTSINPTSYGQYATRYVDMRTDKNGWEREEN